MAIAICEYDETMTAAVSDFNDRLRAGGVSWRFPPSHIPTWLPRQEGRRIYQQLFLALDEQKKVRGGYCIKHQDFLVGGRTTSIGQIALPLSEGILNRAFSQIGTQLLLHAVRQQPLLYALGMGAEEEAITKLVQAAGWRVITVPFYFRVLRPFRFLRNIHVLRRSASRRAALDALAYTGAGWAVGQAESLVQRFRRPHYLSVHEVVEGFTDWTDELWEAVSPDYRFCAVRDMATLKILYPQGNQRFMRIRVSESGRTVGWAVVLCTDLNNHKQFGNMRVGSIVDGFSRRQDAVRIVVAAERLLADRAVDLIVSNQCHESWSGALRRAGFYAGPSNFLLATSRKLTELLTQMNIAPGEIHMNRGDGDGPINL